jgi:hypothetical protein
MDNPNRFKDTGYVIQVPEITIEGIANSTDIASNESVAITVKKSVYNAPKEYQDYIHNLTQIIQDAVNKLRFIEVAECNGKSPNEIIQQLKINQENIK